MKKFMNIFTTVVISFAIGIGIYFTGYLVGKERGYYQRRNTEIEIGQMLYKRSKQYKKNSLVFKNRY